MYLIYMYQEDLAFNNLQGLICHKTQPNQIFPCETSNFLNDPRKYMLRLHVWQVHPPKPKPCNVVWNEQMQA